MTLSKLSGALAPGGFFQRGRGPFPTELHKFSIFSKI